jgi:LCP family protein required for cell wall assembly
VTQTQGKSNLHQSKISGESRAAAPSPRSARSFPTIRNTPLMRGVFRAVAFAAVATTSAMVGLASALMMPLPAQLVPNDRGPETLDEVLSGFQYRVSRPVNILVMGVDRVPEAKPGTPEIFEGRSDTMLLLRVDPTDDSVRLLSIPRDTQIELPESGVITKINDANARGGAQLATAMVSSLLNGVSIDRYVRLSSDAFRELIDLLGGVEVYVPQPMVYEDKTQKLKIDLSPGLQTLNGDQAEQFARFRQDGYGDIGRVQRQQALLKALLKKLTSPAALPRIPTLLGKMQQYIDTNLSVEEMLALVGVGRKLSQGNVKMVMLPGRFSQPGEFRASYWLLDPQGRDRVMQQYFQQEPPLASITTDMAPDAGRSGQSLRIAVQNASNEPRAAQEVRRYLTTLGYRNVYITDDWAEKQVETQIVVQQGDLQGADDLRTMLGFGMIAADSTGDLESDLTLRVGDDWQTQSKALLPESNR